MKVIRYIFVALAIYVVLGIIAGVALENFTGSPTPEIGPGSAIEFTIGPDYGESSSPSLSSILQGNTSLPHFSVLNTLRRAAGDDRISGVKLHISDASIGFAQLQELDAAFDALHAAGKWSQSFIETAGEGGSGTMAYLLASMAQKVAVSPPGDVNFAPLSNTQIFLKETLDSLDVDVKIYQRKEFKSAGEFLSRTNMSESARAAMKALLDDIQSDIIAMVASNRNVDPIQVREWLENPVNGSEDALNRGLVDSRSYEDEVQDEVKSKLGPEGELFDFYTYAREGFRFRGETRLALIVAEGQIVRGDPSPSFTDSEPGIASAPYQRAFRQARKDNVAAVLLRVDSPGGSYIASDLIRREVELTTKAGIPVIVSMGNLAASGGYFISFDADTIFANSATLTGSIGVIMMDISMRRALENQLGMRFDGYRTFESAEIFDPLTQSKRRQEYLDASIDRIYADFIGKAAKGRKMEIEEFEELAKGRVWTGRAAKERKLIDQVGGFEDAVQAVLKAANVDAASASFYQYPLPESPLEEILLSLQNVEMSLQTLVTVGKLLRNADLQEAQLRMPPLEIH